MKNIIKIGSLLLLLCLTIHFHDSITNFIIQNIIFKQGVIIEHSNEYKLSYSFNNVQETTDFYAKDKKHVLNILYTALNNGNDTFYFYCDYDNCEQDIQSMKDNEIADINNFLHPYNTYVRLRFTLNSLHKITVDVDKSYSQDYIIKVEEKMNEIIKDIIKEDMSIKDKITVFHDYIIANTQYDQSYIKQNLNDIHHPSHKAIGPLIYGKALCGGYTEVMSIFLNRLQIPNYRIASNLHVWNLVNLDNQWLHLDLTWDDPNEEMILHTFLLITTEQLNHYQTNRHQFDTNTYKEAMIK